MNWMCMPIDEEFKDVNRGNPPPDTTASFALDYEGDTLYRESKQPGHHVLERAAIISGEFRPHLFESGGDRCAAFAVLGPTPHGAAGTYMLIKADGQWKVLWRSLAYLA